MIHGIDLFHDDSMPDLIGYDFLIHKATQGGNFVDGECQGRIAQARDAGLVVGYYHFLTTDAIPDEQFAHFMDTAQPEPGDILALDFEDDGTWSGMSASELADIADEFLYSITIEATRNRWLLYCDMTTYSTIVSPFKVPQQDGLWIAHPGAEPAIQHVIWQDTTHPVDQDTAKFSTRADMALWADAERPATQSGEQGFLLANGD